MRTEEERDRLRETSLVFVVSTLVVLLFVAFAARLSAQEPATLPVTRVTAYSFPSGQGAKIKGLIIGRQGDDMIVRDQEGRADIVTLTAETKISSPSGLFKMDKKHRDVSNLLPGLIVEIKGSGGDRGNLVADKISFHSSAESGRAGRGRHRDAEAASRSEHRQHQRAEGSWGGHAQCVQIALRG